MTRKKACQSCGMPLAVDGRATNADGSKSAVYCAQCYQRGRFTSPDITVDQMRDTTKLRLEEMGLAGFLAGLVANRVPKLERWKKK